jgi:hypothetical protein
LGALSNLETDLVWVKINVRRGNVATPRADPRWHWPSSSHHFSKIFTVTFTFSPVIRV